MSGQGQKPDLSAPKSDFRSTRGSGHTFTYDYSGYPLREGAPLLNALLYGVGYVHTDAARQSTLMLSTPFGQGCFTRPLEALYETHRGRYRVCAQSNRLSIGRSVDSFYRCCSIDVLNDSAYPAGVPRPVVRCLDVAILHGCRRHSVRANCPSNNEGQASFARFRPAKPFVTVTSLCLRLIGRRSRAQRRVNPGAAQKT